MIIDIGFSIEFVILVRKFVDVIVFNNFFQDTNQTCHI